MRQLMSIAMKPEVLFKAIHSATGITRDQITSRSRKIEFVYARMIVVYWLNKSVQGVNVTKKYEIIGEIINRDRNTVHYVAAKLDFELNHNNVFKYQLDRIDGILKNESSAV